jgi:hypothetical protein
MHGMLCTLSAAASLDVPVQLRALTELAHLRPADPAGPGAAVGTAARRPARRVDGTGAWRKTSPSSSSSPRRRRASPIRRRRPPPSASPSARTRAWQRAPPWPCMPMRPRSGTRSPTASTDPPQQEEVKVLLTGQQDCFRESGYPDIPASIQASGSVRQAETRQRRTAPRTRLGPAAYCP